MYYLDENNEWQEIVLEPSGDTLPVGAITQFGGSTAPTNWLFCNGQAVSRTDYAELFEAIGTTYGDGDGSTTFNVPDFSSRSPMGVGTGTDGTNSETTTLGQEKGEYEHQLTVNELASHNHAVLKIEGISPQGGGVDPSYGITNVSRTQNSGNTGGNQAHNTIHPVLGVNFIIKAKQSIGIVGTVTEDITDTNNNAVPTCKTVKNYVDTKSLETYSTEETVIGTWLGKPLYRKTINFGTLPNNTSKDVAHNISNIDTFVKIYGIAKSSSNQLPLPYVNPNNVNYGILVQCSTTNITVEAKYDRSNYTAYIILEYTKTTD